MRDRPSCVVMDVSSEAGSHGVNKKQFKLSFQLAMEPARGRAQLGPSSAGVCGPLGLGDSPRADPPCQPTAGFPFASSRLLALPSHVTVSGTHCAPVETRAIGFVTPQKEEIKKGKK